MTLHTRVMITSPSVTPRAVFDRMRELIGATDEFTWTHTREGRTPSYSMRSGQGLPALMWVDYGADGPMVADHDHEGWEPDGLERLCAELCDPEGFVEVNFDTAYGYRAGNGAGCGDLHAYLLHELGRWLDDHGASWRWYDESGDGWASTRSLGDPGAGRPDLPVGRDLDPFLWPARTAAV